MHNEATESDFIALETEVEELLTLLQDRQPGMKAFHPLVIKHIETINKLATILFDPSTQR